MRLKVSAPFRLYLLPLLVASGAAYGQSVYRCTQPDGKVGYQSSPCASGRSSPVRLHVDPSVAERKPIFPTTSKKSGEASISVICPEMVAPKTPAEAARKGLTGSVVARARIRGGVVTDVEILSGTEVYRQAVITAMKSYKCVASDKEVLATQHFEFRFE